MPPIRSKCYLNWGQYKLIIVNTVGSITLHSNEKVREEMVLSNTRKTHYTFSHECELFCSNTFGIQRNKLPCQQCHLLSMDVSRLTSLLCLCGICDNWSNSPTSLSMNWTEICTSQGSGNCLFLDLFGKRCAYLIRSALYNSSTPVQQFHTAFQNIRVDKRIWRVRLWTIFLYTSHDWNRFHFRKNSGKCCNGVIRDLLLILHQQCSRWTKEVHTNTSLFH